MSDIGHIWTNEPYFSLGAPASPPASVYRRPAGTPALPGRQPRRFEVADLASDSSRPSVSPLDNAFSPTYLARLRERDDSLTAAEAELAPEAGQPALQAVAGAGAGKR